MLQIGDTLISLDVIEKFFCCDLDKCHGQCCVEGDAGAPLSQKEADVLAKYCDEVSELISSDAKEEISRQGVAYTDSEGDLVTSIVHNKDCVFTCYSGNVCLCALEKASREGKIPNIKPISCSLYPIRLKEFPTFTAVNLHIWDVCKDAFIKGKNENIRVYQFLKEPLIKRFGKEWYDELQLTAEIYLQEKKS